MRRRLEERYCEFCGALFEPYRTTQVCCNGTCQGRRRLEKKGTKYIKNCTECGKSLPSNMIKTWNHVDVLCSECHNRIVEMSKSNLSLCAKAARKGGVTYGMYMAGCKSCITHVAVEKVDKVEVSVRR